MEAVRRFRSERVLLNYDFGNVLINSRGAVDPADDFSEIKDGIGHLHLKDVLRIDGMWQWTAIGEGTINYAAIWARLKELPTPLPMTVDLPLNLVQRDGAPAEPRADLLSLSEIDSIMDVSRRRILAGLGETELT